MVFIKVVRNIDKIIILEYNLSMEISEMLKKIGLHVKEAEVYWLFWH